MAYTTRQKARTELRFSLGDRVECNIGRIGEEVDLFGIANPMFDPNEEFDPAQCFWSAGAVVDVWYREEEFVDPLGNPLWAAYRVQPDDGGPNIFVPFDADQWCRAVVLHDAPSRATRLSFGRGLRFEFSTAMFGPPCATVAGARCTVGEPMLANSPLAGCVEGTVVIVRRGDAKFSQKAVYAQEAGAIGVICINTENKIFPFTAGKQGSLINIPMIMISSVDGERLLSELAFDPNSDVSFSFATPVAKRILNCSTTNDVARLRELYDQGEDLSAARYTEDPDDFYTAVHTAASNGRVQVMELLAELYGNEILINPLTKGKPGATPAHAAAMAGRIETLRYIFEFAPPGSAVFTTTDMRGASPAMCAIEGGHLECLNLMYELGGKALLRSRTRSSFQPNVGGWTLLHHAAFSRKDQCLAEIHRLMSLDAPELIEVEDDQGMTVGHVAAVAKHHQRCSPECECHLEAGQVIRTLARLGINLIGSDPPIGPLPPGHDEQYVPTPFWLACMNNNLPQIDALARIPGVKTRVAITDGLLDAEVDRSVGDADNFDGEVLEYLELLNNIAPLRAAQMRLSIATASIDARSVCHVLSVDLLEEVASHLTAPDVGAALWEAKQREIREYDTVPFHEQPVALGDHCILRSDHPGPLWDDCRVIEIEYAESAEAETSAVQQNDQHLRNDWPEHEDILKKTKEPKEVLRFKLHFEAFGSLGEFDRWFRPAACVEKLRWRNRTKLSVLSPSNVWRDCVIVAEGYEHVIVTDDGERKIDGWQVSQRDTKNSGRAMLEALGADSVNGGGEREGIKVHYCGFDVRNDEWLPKDSDRIRWTAQHGRVCDGCGESEHAGAIFNHGQTWPTPSGPWQTATKKAEGEADGVTLCLRCVSGQSSYAQTLAADSAVDSTLGGASSHIDSKKGGADVAADADDVEQATCFQPGDEVLIHGLTSPAGFELNDRRGTIHSFDRESGRYVVTVVGMARPKRLKQKNLRPLAQALAERKRLAVAFEHV